MRARLWASLIGTVVIVVGLLVANLAAGNTPTLGIDLQGGVSVILQPVEEATGEDLIVVRDLIRDELERTGIAEPDVRVQGANIVVDLPGVKDSDEALSRVDVSGVVELRPVLIAGCTTSPLLGTDDGGVEDADLDPTPATDDLVESAPAVASAGIPDVRPASLRTPPTVPPDDSGDPDAPIEIPDLSTETAGVPGAEFLPTRDGQVLCVGAVAGTGEVFSRGSANVTGHSGWAVAVGLRDESTWNALANQCFQRTALCPSGQIAIVLDSEVQSAPVVQTNSFTDEVQITGSFTQSEAESLSRVLNRGAFPVEVEAQQVETISASAGSQSLRAAVIAGLIGVMLVLTFLVFYYRWLALVIIAGLTIWAMTVFVAASLVSSWTNYSLSLAGVTGIIVAVGVTVDSYVVFFERMKDEIRNGRTLRNAAPRSFNATWRTIWTADLVSVIGASILFWLSVGSVRGFALFLGITTLCDLFVCFFFTRPAVVLLARSSFMRGRRAFGLDVAT
jgi:preprotein translocase subunit SecD